MDEAVSPIPLSFWLPLAIPAMAVLVWVFTTTYGGARVELAPAAPDDAPDDDEPDPSEPTPPAGP